MLLCWNGPRSLQAQQETWMNSARSNPLTPRPRAPLSDEELACRDHTFRRPVLSATPCSSSVSKRDCLLQSRPLGHGADVPSVVLLSSLTSTLTRWREVNKEPSCERYRKLKAILLPPAPSQSHPPPPQKKYALSIFDAKYKIWDLAESEHWWSLGSSEPESLRHHYLIAWCDSEARTLTAETDSLPHNKLRYISS